MIMDAKHKLVQRSLIIMTEGRETESDDMTEREASTDTITNITLQGT